MVAYCGKAHQKDDWKIHMSDCEVFRRCGIQGKLYTDTEMLAKFPLTKSPSPLPLDVCGICESPPGSKTNGNNAMLQPAHLQHGE